jgi:hypothetical protein
MKTKPWNKEQGKDNALHKFNLRQSGYGLMSHGGAYLAIRLPDTPKSTSKKHDKFIIMNVFLVHPNWFFNWIHETPSICINGTTTTEIATRAAHCLALLVLTWHYLGYKDIYNEMDLTKDEPPDLAYLFSTNKQLMAATGAEWNSMMSKPKRVNSKLRVQNNVVIWPCQPAIIRIPALRRHTRLGQYIRFDHQLPKLLAKTNWQNKRIYLMVQTLKGENQTNL